MRIPVNGITLNVEQAGSGTALVLLHGFTGSTQTWATLSDGLAHHFRLVAIDLIGHGASDSPADPDRYSMDHAAFDILSLLALFGIERFSLLGYSMGGRAALHIALAAPERIDALILESASPGLARVEERELRVYKDGEVADMLEREGIESFVEYWERQPLFAGLAGLSADVRAETRAQRLHNCAQGLANSLRAAGAGKQESLWHRLHEVSAPTLLIVGEKDEKFSEIGRQMKVRMPRAELEVLTDAGHCVHLEQPSTFEGVVVRFLSECNCASFDTRVSGRQRIASQDEVPHMFGSTMGSTHQ